MYYTTSEKFINKLHERQYFYYIWEEEPIRPICRFMQDNEYGRRPPYGLENCNRNFESLDNGEKMKEDNVRELIYCIEKRPGMYVGDNRIDYIFHLLIGHLGAIHENEVDCLYRTEFSHWIHDWIIKNKCSQFSDIKFDFLWYKMIYSVTNNEEEAWKLFFQIAHEYFDQLRVEE